MAIANIHNKRELEDYIQQLRLHQLPFTMETLDELRRAIQDDKLYSLLKKYIEREFANQWKQLCVKNKLTGWPLNHDQPLKPIKKKETNPSTKSMEFTEQLMKPMTAPKEKGESLISKVLRSGKKAKKNKPAKIRKTEQTFVYNPSKKRTIMTEGFGSVRREDKRKSSQGVYIKDLGEVSLRLGLSGKKHEESASSKLYEDYEYGLSDW